MGIIIAIVGIAVVLFVIRCWIENKKRITCDHCGTKYSKEDVTVYDMGERDSVELSSGDNELVERLIIFDIVCKCPNCKTVKHKTAKLPARVNITDKYGTYKGRPDAAHVKERWSFY